jgi:hypothetical protein
MLSHNIFCLGFQGHGTGAVFGFELGLAPWPTATPAALWHRCFLGISCPRSFCRLPHTTDGNGRQLPCRHPLEKVLNCSLGALLTRCFPERRD